MTTFPSPLRLLTVERPLMADELEVAASMLGGAAEPTALAALALPAHVLPDAELQITPAGVTWRGQHLEAADYANPDAVAAWAAAGWILGESAAVPRGPLWHWVRFVRSGVNVVVWGPRALWSGPDVICDPNVNTDVIFDMFKRWWAGEEIAAPAIVSGPGGTMVFIDGDETSWRVNLPGFTASPEHPDDGAIAALVEATAAELGATDWVISRPKRREQRWVVQLGLCGWTATFDVHTQPGTVTVGRRFDLGPVLDGTDLPDGWVPASAAGDMVCACSATGLWAVLQPAR